MSDTIVPPTGPPPSSGGGITSPVASGRTPGAPPSAAAPRTTTWTKIIDASYKVYQSGAQVKVTTVGGEAFDNPDTGQPAGHGEVTCSLQVLGALGWFIHTAISFPYPDTDDAFAAQRETTQRQLAAIADLLFGGVGTGGAAASPW